MNLVMIGGAICGTGIVLILLALFPTEPHLSSAITRLYGPGPGPDQPGGSGAVSRLGRTLARRAWFSERVRAPRRDLELIGKPVSEFFGEKAVLAGLGLVFPFLMTTLMTAAGMSLPLALPAIAGPAMAALLWWLPDVDAARRAAESRREFDKAVSSYIDLVAMERRGGTGAAQALEVAAQGGSTWAFVRIRQTLERARWSHTSAWQALAELAEQVDSPPLHDLADIMALSGEDGVGSYETLRARSRSIRNAELTAEQTRAHQANEQMVIPVSALALVFVAMLGAPAVMRIAGGS